MKEKALRGRGSTIRVALLPAVLIMILAGPLSAETRESERILIPGTSVSLVPPSSFVLAENFTGLAYEDLGASVMILEFPAPLDSLSGGLKVGKSSQGMQILSNEAARFESSEGRLLRVEQLLADVEWKKWIGMIERDGTTAMLVATMPEFNQDELSAALKACVLSARFEDIDPPDFFEALGFRITETRSLKIAHRMSDMLMLTTNGQKQISAPGEPMAVVGSSYSEMEILDLGAYAELRIQNIGTVNDVEILSGESLEVDGLPAYAIEARGKHYKAGIDLAVYQLIVLKGDIYYLLQGIVAADQAERYVPEYEELGQSLKIARE